MPRYPRARRAQGAALPVVGVALDPAGRRDHASRPVGRHRHRPGFDFGCNMLQDLAQAAQEVGNNGRIVVDSEAQGRHPRGEHVMRHAVVQGRTAGRSCPHRCNSRPPTSPAPPAARTRTAQLANLAIKGGDPDRRGQPAMCPDRQIRRRGPYEQVFECGERRLRPVNPQARRLGGPEARGRRGSEAQGQVTGRRQAAARAGPPVPRRPLAPPLRACKRATALPHRSAGRR